MTPPDRPAYTAVTLSWDDPEAAGEFLRLRSDLRRDGWLSDPAAEALRELVGSSRVKPVGEAGGVPVTWGYENRTETARWEADK